MTFIFCHTFGGRALYSQGMERHARKDLGETRFGEQMGHIGPLACRVGSLCP
jgi:hypothetical protein